MKLLMKILLLMILLLIVESCNFFQKFDPGYWKWKNKFKNELIFVQKIIDNPDKMQEIIESSEYFNKNHFKIDIGSYRTYKAYIKQNKSGEVELYGFGRTTIYGDKGEVLYDDAKIIEVDNERAEYRLGFVFLVLENKTILYEIQLITK